MLGFTPFKKHANKFNYTPRYYDPEKEAREQRRAELRGERSEDAGKEYVAGQYIRTQHDARSARRESLREKGQQKMLKMVVVAVLLLLVIYLLYPRLAEVFIRANTAPTAKPAELEQVDEFDPSAPITIVPNDYKEE